MGDIVTSDGRDGRPDFGSVDSPKDGVEVRANAGGCDRPVVGAFVARDDGCEDPLTLG